MSRTIQSWALLIAPFAMLPLIVACASSPTPKAASASDRSEAADAKAKGDDASDMAADPDVASPSATSEKSSDKSDKSEPKSDAKSDAADEDKAPVDDSRTTASIANVIKENRKPFKKCYEDVRKEQPELKGNVLLKIVLDGAGKVKKAYVDDESSIRNQKVTDCMIKLAQSLTYPKSSKGLDKDFEYDFGFNNQTK
ncbi:MAG TPA: AgmX/PglI C-terminal domain-containing protein [Polyangiaceae bacterium]